MKAYFDTNIIIDILQRREPFYESSRKSFMLVVDEKVDGIVGTSAITDIFYLTKKKYPDAKTAMNVIFDILDIIKPVTTTVDDIYNTAKLDLTDFEDAIIAATARREKADFIITRNTKDFANSPIPAITPYDFLEKNC